MKAPRCPETTGARSARLRKSQRKVRFKLTKRHRRRALLNATWEARHPKNSALRHVSRGRVPLRVPSRLSLEDAYDATVAFIRQLRRLVLEDRLPVFLIFDDLSEVEVAATLVLTAEIDRCFKFGKVGLVNGNYPQDEIVYHKLETLGFFHLLGIRNLRGSAPRMKQSIKGKTATYVSGNIVDPEAIDSFLNGLFDGVDDVSPMTRRDLYACMIEAMKNAFEHANKKPAERRPLPSRWWMTGTVEPDAGCCNIVMFDQGAGIPQTLPQETAERVANLFRRIGRRSSDSAMIRAATRLGRSSTGLRGRGKGFGTMKKLVSRSRDGELLIYSLRGRYRFAPHALGGSKPERVDRNESLGGTLVQWRMQHRSAMDGAP